MADEIDALRRVPLFSGMSDRDLQNVIEITKEVTHPEGHVIVEEDQSAIGFHLILEGSAEASVAGQSVGTIGPGDYFGEMSLLDGKPRSATVQATSDMKTLVVPSWSFNQLLDANPAIMRTLLVELCARLRRVEALRG